jgi:NAD-specific glutamate dehydrogenase
LRTLISPKERERATRRYDRWLAAGVPEELANVMCTARSAHHALAIVEIAHQQGIPPTTAEDTIRHWLALSDDSRETGRADS